MTGWVRQDAATHIASYAGLSRVSITLRKTASAGKMSTIQQTAIPTLRPRIDWTKPVLYLFAALLVVLIVMPLSWLAVYSVSGKDGRITLQNFVTLFSDPDFLD